jgi:hypothetical protein
MNRSGNVRPRRQENGVSRRMRKSVSLVPIDP